MRRGRLRNGTSVGRQEAAVALVFLLFAANFNAYRVFGDGEVAYGLLRTLFGEDVHDVYAYQFGLALMNAPFYALGVVLESAGLNDLQGSDVRPAMISLASNAFVVAALVVTGALLAALEFRRRAVVLGAAVFGTPLMYYGVFSPAYAHAADALLVTVAVALTYAIFSREEGRADVLALGLGLVLALATTVRYFDAAVALSAVVSLFLFGRRRAAALAASGYVVAIGALLLVPRSLGVPLFSDDLGPGRLAFSPLSPVRMLVTDERGLFVWTPVTLLSVVGLALLIRDRPQLRPFAITIAAMSASLLLAYAAWPDWQGGWSFSQRFLTALFPVYAIGLAALIERSHALAALAVACAGWSTFLAFNHVFGASQSDGATDIAWLVAGGERSASDFLDLVRAYSRLKYLF